jgi:hypothetical protein
MSKVVALMLVCVVGVAKGAYQCTVTYSSDDCSGNIDKVLPVRRDGVCNPDDHNINMCDQDLGGVTVYQYASDDNDCSGQAISQKHYNDSRTRCQKGNPDTYHQFCSIDSGCSL